MQAEATRLLLEAGDKLDGWRAAFVKTATRSVIGGSAPEVAGDSANLGDEPEDLLEELSVKRVLDPLGERSEKGVDGVLVMAQVRQRRIVGIEDQRVWLKAASRAVDDHFANVFRRQRLRRHQLVWGSIALVAVLFGVLVLVGFGITLEGSDQVLREWQQFLLVISLGALGASLSGLLTVSRTDSAQRVPDIRAQRHFVWLRPAIGAAASIVSIGTLAALGLIPEVGPPGEGSDAASAVQFSLYMVAFVAGFSEQFVTRTLASASGGLAK